MIKTIKNQQNKSHNPKKTAKEKIAKAIDGVGKKQHDLSVIFSIEFF